MNFIVTGGAGFIGTNLIKRLVKENHKVVSIDNYNTGKEDNHIEGATYIKADIRTVIYEDILDKYFNGEKIDVFYHLAALARIQPSFNIPLEYFEVNGTGTYRVVEFCKKNKIKLQYAGSSSHHSGKFKNPYTFSKDIGEEIVFLYQDLYGLKATVTRFYNVYGPHHLKEGGYCTLIGKWEKAYENNEPFIIYGTGLKRRDFTHVDDIIDALLLIQKKSKYGYVFELGYGKNWTIEEIFKKFKYGKVIYEDDKPGEAEMTLCSDNLANEILGWRPHRKIEDYIAKFIKEQTKGV